MESSLTVLSESGVDSHLCPNAFIFFSNSTKCEVRVMIEAILNEMKVQIFCNCYCICKVLLSFVALYKCTMFVTFTLISTRLGRIWKWKFNYQKRKSKGHLNQSMMTLQTENWPYAAKVSLWILSGHTETVWLMDLPLCLEFEYMPVQSYCWILKFTGYKTIQSSREWTLL